MTLAVLFWVLMLLALFSSYPGNTVLGARGPWLVWSLEFVLFGILGWAVFGPAIRG